MKHLTYKVFNGTVVNRGMVSLHGGSLKITHTIPLINNSGMMDSKGLPTKDDTVYDNQQVKLSSWPEI